MCAVGSTSNLNNLNATKQPPGVECSRERGYFPTPLPISSQASFLSLTYHKSASERPIVVLSKLGLYSSGSQFELRQNTTYSEQDLSSGSGIPSNATLF
jgi:hypothetical protein